MPPVNFEKVRMPEQIGISETVQYVTGLIYGRQSVLKCKPNGHKGAEVSTTEMSANRSIADNASSGVPFGTSMSTLSELAFVGDNTKIPTHCEFPRSYDTGKWR